MSRPVFEPLGKSAALENLVAIADMRGLRVVAAKWAHEVKAWGGSIQVLGADGRRLGVVQTVYEGEAVVRKVKVRHD